MDSAALASVTFCRAVRSAHLRSLIRSLSSLMVGSMLSFWRPHFRGSGAGLSFVEFGTDNSLTSSSIASSKVSI
ncbi:hypothetical protein PI126_g8735 [Phytophthora idaei]|nr:hypothetical protein PI126_g8735 [Phytophthora idaei]